MKHLVIATLLVAALAAPAWAQNSANSRSLNNEDKEFINKVMDGNLAEATLGQLAEQKAANPAVKEFGRWMATDHGFANKRLMEIAKEANYNRQPALTAKDKAMEQQLQGLSGSQFDNQYLKGMVQDHQQTIALFRAQAQSGQDQHLKTYAQDLLPVLQQHLAEAQELASAGGVAGTAPSGSSTQHDRQNH